MTTNDFDASIARIDATKVAGIIPLAVLIGEVG